MGGAEVLEEGPQKGGGRPLGGCALEGMGKICRKRAGWERWDSGVEEACLPLISVRTVAGTFR